MEFGTAPDNWREQRYDVGPSIADGEHMEKIDAQWLSDDEQIVIDLKHTVDDDGGVSYSIVVQQKIEDDETGWSTGVQSHVRVEDDRKSAEEAVQVFMDDVNDGYHKLRVLGTELWRDEYVQFYCLSDSEVPGNLTADQLIEAIDTENFEDDIEDIDESEMDESDVEMIDVVVDIYPRHVRDVDGYDNDEDNGSKARQL